MEQFTCDDTEYETKLLFPQNQSPTCSLMRYKSRHTGCGSLASFLFPQPRLPALITFLNAARKRAITPPNWNSRKESSSRQCHAGGGLQGDIALTQRRVGRTALICPCSVCVCVRLSENNNL